MAIEPMNSVMTFQAQQMPQSNNTQKEVRTTDGQSFEPVKNIVDEQTLAIHKTENDGSNPEQQNDKENGDFNEELMRQAMKELNKKATNVEAEFGIHEKTNRITIKMVDKQTKEVIKELPPEKMLDMIARIWEVSGLIVDEKR